MTRIVLSGALPLVAGRAGIDCEVLRRAPADWVRCAWAVKQELEQLVEAIGVVLAT